MNSASLRMILKIIVVTFFVVSAIAVILVVFFISNLGVKENKMLSNLKSIQVPEGGKEIYYKEAGSPTCLDSCTSLSRVYAYNISVDKLQQEFILLSKKQGYIITDKYNVGYVSLSFANLNKKIDSNDLIGFASFFVDFSQTTPGRQGLQKTTNSQIKSYLEVNLRYGYFDSK